MRVPRLSSLLALSLGLASTATASLANGICNRKCMTALVQQIIDSWVAKNPYTLPMAQIYKATENSHPAALGMMTAWHTIEAAGSPSLLAIDVHNQTAYFAMDVSEGNAVNQTIVRCRIAVVNHTISEIELFMNRYRGDHGFSFNSTELPSNYETLMNPPANRTKATRRELYALSASLFNPVYTEFNVSSACQFTELGWRVVDPGTWNNGSTSELGCILPSFHPTDVNARVALVVDEDLGFVLTSGIVPGKALAYQNVSAFIPDSQAGAQEAQLVYYNDVAALANPYPLVYAFAATGDTLELLQYYNGALQAEQINVYLSGPNMTSTWLS